ncbi:peptidoglycan D,D-transpeptidase FtsI family protein [Persicirhabdus sediminis]|uniref:Penicillin-binding protein 2 n=1 Tax=Persicirhabdus sediminis TaxID=454144 RepID=A0A8J7SG01_9BACT|nr:penicillin-binding protein 2 [Persicirhabdus sediminis]MBK1789795.1 penicillin-binding protein 2 [Persicirhabdus sediminis]
MKDATFHRRCLLLCLSFVLGLSGLSARLVYLQVVKHEDFKKAGEAYKRKKRVLVAERGWIVDRNEVQLARNIPLTTVKVDMRHLFKEPSLAACGLAYRDLRDTTKWKQLDPLKDRAKRRAMIRLRQRRIMEDMTPASIVEEHFEYAISELARPLGMTEDALRDRIKNTKLQELTIRKDLPEDRSDDLEKLVKERWICGFFFEQAQRRWYVYPELAAHVIGFVNYEGEGRSGVEQKFNNRLQGRDGFVIEEKSANNLLLPSKVGMMLPPAHGLNVQLTIDIQLQHILEEELDAGLEEFEAETGCIVLMKPDTGEILGMVSRPSYNLNIRENAAKNGFSFATQASYEPGSTIKIVAAAAALDQGLVNLDTVIDTGWMPFRHGSVTVKDHHYYGELSTAKVMAKSSNIGTYKFGLLLGQERYYDYLKKFGFGKKTGINLAGESAGITPLSDNPTDFSRATFGYSNAVTPLQIASAYSAIANGGQLMKPQIIKSVITNDGAVIEQFEPEVVRRVISKRAAKDMRTALAGVVDVTGTARRAKVEGFEGNVGGKTGTVWKHDPVNGGYLFERYTVSFVGLLPADKPEFVCVVVVDDPQTTEVKRYGGTIAAPIFAKVARRVAARMGIAPTNPIENNQEVAEKRKES